MMFKFVNCFLIFLIYQFFFSVMPSVRNSLTPQSLRRNFQFCNVLSRASVLHLCIQAFYVSNLGVLKGSFFNLNCLLSQMMGFNFFLEILLNFTFSWEDQGRKYSLFSSGNIQFYIFDHMQNQWLIILNIQIQSKQFFLLIHFQFSVEIINTNIYDLLSIQSQELRYKMQGPLSPKKSKSQSFKEALNAYSQAITKIYPAYAQKINSLAFHKQLIITNPKSFVNLFESKELNQQKDEDLMLNAWSAISELVLYIFKVMPINSTFVYKDATFIVFIDEFDKESGYRSVNCVEYLIIKIFSFLEKHDQVKKNTYLQQDEGQKMKLKQRQKKIMDVVSKLYVIFHNFMQNCCIRTKSLKLITQILSNKFYSGSLTVKMLQTSLNMFSQINDSTVSNTDTGNLHPFLYFNGSAKIGMRLLITNNKWPFNKGMHLCLWMKSFLEVQSPNSYIMHLKVDDKNWFIVRQERTEVVIQSAVEGERNKRIVCDFPIRQLVKFEIVLEPKQSGSLFKSNYQYRLHMRINKQQTKNIEIKLPRFDSGDYVTEFNMFGQYFGQFYTLALWKSTDSFQEMKDKLPQSLESQFQVNSFIEKNPNVVEQMLTLLSPLRVYKGILVNMINNEQNHACHEATTLLNQLQTKKNRFLMSFSQIILPYLYFVSKLWRENSQSTLQEAQQIKFECEKFINALLQQYCKARINYCEQTQTSQKMAKVKNNILQNCKLTIMFILYWLQNLQYPVNQSTISSILELSLSSSVNYQPLFFKYLDKNILASKNIKILQIYKSKKNKSKLGEKLKEIEDVEDYDPVTKLQIMFYLETTWKDLWNKYQYMTQWWQPLNLKMQNDKPFNEVQYSLDKKNGQIEKPKKNSPHPWIQWVVSQFITNDFCDCLILPLILDPTYIKLGEQPNNKPSPFLFNKYQELYTKKQCMTEDFQEPYFLQTVLNKEQNEKFTFKKVIKTLMGRFFDKVGSKISQSLQNDGIQSSPRKLIKSLNPDNQNKIIRFQTDACYLNLLTLVLGTIAIEVRGKSAFIYFYQKHASKMMDHMCVKAYKNQDFIYICIDLGDVRFIKRRRFNQSMNGMEIRLKSGHGYLFYFHERNVDKFNLFLKQNTKNVKNRMDTVFKDPYDQYLASNHTTLWIDKKISNWEYLQWLNDIAGRSYSDITQYPILPWVFKQDIKAPEVALNNEGSYRDLTKNMGSFGPEDRINHFKDKYNNAGENEMFSQYHFGTHYSSSAIIFNFLIRLRPFSVGAVTLQSGKFDCADRVFSSYIGSWHNATNSPTDIRQLIPEIYLLPEMMVNMNTYDFGTTQVKQRICNVQLPKWCNKNPYVFCKYLRKSLQNQFVSQKINHWIDLIYGYKQKGPAAVESMNIFFPLTYQLAINVQKITDDEQRVSIQTQIAHFGQNPAQIIGSSPHPIKSSIKQKWQNKLLADCNEIVIQKCSLTRMNTGEVKFIFQSVFEDKNSILSIKFMSESIFIVLRRYQFCLFKILDNKSGFISKQKQIEFVTEKDNISLDYQNIATYVPMVSVIYKSNKSQLKEQDDGLTGTSIAIVGGFFNGTLQIIYLNDVRASGTLRMPFSTVTALAFSQDYNYLYIGDSEGKLGVYLLNIINPFSPTKQLQLQEKFRQQVHDLKINSISINKSANLFLTASQDGTVKMFNLYTQQLYRKIINPSKYPIVFARISTCPLYCIVFYSEENSMIYSYSINGQYLASFQDTTGFIYNMGVIYATDHCQSVIYLNAQRQIYILELPELKSKKKIRLKKDEFKISCFEMTNQIAIAGSQDGALQIIADPSSF